MLKIIYKMQKNKQNEIENKYGYWNCWQKIRCIKTDFLKILKKDKVYRVSQDLGEKITLMEEIGQYSKKYFEVVKE